MAWKIEDDRVPATMWVNVGTMVDGEEGKTFIGLGRGIPFDEVEAPKGKGFISSNRRTLVNTLTAVFDSMKPGDEKVVETNGLTIQLYKVAEATEADTDDIDTELLSLFG